MSKNTIISGTAVIEEDCKIGNNVRIEDFVFIHTGTVIGDNVTIHQNVVVGTPPFVVRRNVKGEYDVKPHNVIIDDNVEIWPNTVIQWGMERSTTIGKNTVINTLCHIGHDVIVGANVKIGARNGISGHSTIGNNVYFAPDVTVANRVKIGDSAKIGIGSLVLHDVENEQTVLGRPAVKIALYRKERKLFKELTGNTEERILSARKGEISKKVKRKITKIFSLIKRILQKL